MRNPGLAVALLLALAAPSMAAESRGTTSYDPRGRIDMYAVGTGAEYATVLVGEKAPDFNYQVDGRWQRLRDLRAQGHVLLVLGAGDEQLRAIESQREGLLRLGVVPVAVLDLRASSCRAATRKLGLQFTVIPDPTRVIGAQFNSLEPRTRMTAPSWFLIDRGGNIRALDRFEWPTAEWREIASNALGLATDGAPASFGGR